MINVAWLPLAFAREIFLGLRSFLRWLLKRWLVIWLVLWMFTIIWLVRSFTAFRLAFIMFCVFWLGMFTTFERRLFIIKSRLSILQLFGNLQFKSNIVIRTNIYIHRKLVEVWFYIDLKTLGCLQHRTNDNQCKNNPGHKAALVRVNTAVPFPWRLQL